jgi:hypothetical protein
MRVRSLIENSTFYCCGFLGGITWLPWMRCNVGLIYLGNHMFRQFCCLVAAYLAGCATQSPQSLPTQPMASTLPPKYLSIMQFKDCLATQQVSSYRSWCMPGEKPTQCPATSWAQLQALQGSDQMPACPAETVP